MRIKVFHVITKLELGGAQKVTLMTLERLPRDRYELGLVSGPEGLLDDWAKRIPALARYGIVHLFAKSGRSRIDRTFESLAIVPSRTSTDRSYAHFEGRHHRTLGCET